MADTSKEQTDWINAIKKCLESMGRLTQQSSIEKEEELQYSFANPVKVGWLIKSGGNRKNWKRRWCVVKDMFVYYFPTQQSAQPSGSIPLQDSYLEPIKEKSSKKNGFSVVTRYRTYDLFADTPNEMKEWMDLLSALMASRLRIAEMKEIEESKVWKKQTLGETTNVSWETRKKTTRLISCLYQNHQVNHHPIPPQDFPTDLKEQFDLHVPINRNLETLLFQYSAEKVYQQCVGTELITAETTTAPSNQDFPSEFNIFFHLVKVNQKKAVKATATMTVSEAVRLAKQKFARGTIINAQADCTATEADTDFIIKIKGSAEYLLDTNAYLSQLVYVRDAISRKKKIEFALIASSDMKEEIEEHKRAVSNRHSFPQTVLAPSLQEYLLDDPDSIKQDCYALCDISLPFEVRVICVEGGDLPISLPGEKDKEEKISYRVECTLYWGKQKLGNVMKTAKQANPLWGERLVSEIRLQNLPLETRVSFAVYSYDTVIAWVNMYLFDSMGTMLSGLQKIRMWTSKHEPLGSCEENPSPQAPVLNVEYLKPPLPVAYLPDSQATFHESKKYPDAKQLEIINKVITTDPLYQLTAEEKSIFWQFRYYLLYEKANALPKLLQSVEWTDPLQTQEMHALICCWNTLPPMDALALLDRTYPDTVVRDYAVRCLDVLNDFELFNYLLQIVQIIKWETHHDSALARFLLRRALQHKRFIGHALFWHLYAELNSNEVRYQLLLEAYLLGCGPQRKELARQLELVRALRQIANGVKKLPQKPKKIKYLQSELAKIGNTKVVLPLNPRWEASGIIVDKCKSMDSFTCPLWVVFNNADPTGSPLTIIYKVGDDMRQDVLTLQMIREMDILWKKAGLDLQLSPYLCMSTGVNEGMIEVVLNSATAADIQKLAGGATAAFSKTPLYNWLQDHNPGDEMNHAVEIFAASLAGYSIAKYVIGIGDRHNDNIMICKTGHLFHIDFAHFLGNVMKFAGISRERTALVLTKEFAYVMGGEKSPVFNRFVQYCTEGYRIVRKYANLFITLFSLMLSAGLPQLTSEADLAYLDESFAQGMTEEESMRFFYKLIIDSLNSSSATSINFAIHILANPGT